MNLIPSTLAILLDFDHLGLVALMLAVDMPTHLGRISGTMRTVGALVTRRHLALVAQMIAEAALVFVAARAAGIRTDIDVRCHGTLVVEMTGQVALVLVGAATVRCRTLERAAAVGCRVHRRLLLCRGSLLTTLFSDSSLYAGLWGTGAADGGAASR